MLVGAVVPEIKLQAQTLSANLQELVELQKQARRERNGLKAYAGRLVEERRRIDLLIEEKRKRREVSLAELGRERKRAAELAAKALSLEELIGKLEAQVSSVAKAAKKARAAEKAARRRAAKAGGSKARKLAMLSDPNRIEPALPFPQTQGLLPRPARGVRLRAFGEEDGFGSTSKGQAYATRAGAIVSSPCDGWVVYSGPFRSYGQLLILNAGGGYHVLLAGMERTNVEIGQFVLTGEPVALMGKTAPCKRDNVEYWIDSADSANRVSQGRDVHRPGSLVGPTE